MRLSMEMPKPTGETPMKVSMKVKTGAKGGGGKRSGGGKRLSNARAIQTGARWTRGGSR